MAGTDAVGSDLVGRCTALAAELDLGSKSPVEYLDGATRARVRDVARGLIARPADGFDTLLGRLDRATTPT